MANKAAWLTAAQVKPFKVDDALMLVPKADEVVIRNRAVAINPTDWAIQAMGIIILTYPFIEGCDAAGEITAVGSAVKDFKIGDRVIAILDPYGSQNISNAAFQLFSSAGENSIAKLPDNVSYAEASVLPLGISTAASALFQTGTLALPHPQVNPKPTGKVVLVWGGSSSVGACAIQLVVGAGFDVATTASSHNLEYCKTLGAKYVFDHAKDSVVEDITTALKGVDFGGAFCAIRDSDVI
jgi:NADPH:quinone reductase-like Zn-dependent oxidoreductase